MLCILCSTLRLRPSICGQLQFLLAKGKHGHEVTWDCFSQGLCLTFKTNMPFSLLEFCQDPFLQEKVTDSAVILKDSPRAPK